MNYLGDWGTQVILARLAAFVLVSSTVLVWPYRYRFPEIR